MSPCLKSLLFVILTVNLVGAALDVVSEWNLLNFGFPSESDKQQAIANGNLVLANAIPIDVAAHYGANGTLRLFTTAPRFNLGVPYTLATFSGSSNPELQAYPSYSWQNTNGTDCDGITSAFRVTITPCNQMWVIDSGRIGTNQVCPPQLLTFDLNTDRLIHRHRFSEDVYTPGKSLFITSVVKINDPSPKGNCKDTTVYIADVTTYGLVVYDQLQDASWRIENPLMRPDPDATTFTIAGENFTLMDGIFGVNVVGKNLYFHPLASAHEFRVPLPTVNNRTAFQNNSNALEDQFEDIGQRESACAATTSDSCGNIYCVTFNPISLIRWNVETSYTTKNLISMSDNEDLLQFASGMKVVKNPKGEEELWMTTNRYQKFLGGTMQTNETNYRILKLNLNGKC